MKITRRQLRQIISEAVVTDDEPYPKDLQGHIDALYRLTRRDLRDEVLINSIVAALKQLQKSGAT